MSTNIIPVNIPKCTVDKTSARFDSGMTYEEWAHIGGQLAAVNGCIMWWVGDWLLHGAKQYGDRAKAVIQNADTLGFSSETLRTAARVANGLQLELGIRMAELSWAHHAEVSEMKSKEQTKWLAKAREGGWPVAELRRQIRQATCEQSALDSDGPAFKSVGGKLDDVQTWLSRQPADWWTADRKQIWRTRLEPIVTFFNNNLA